MDNSSDDNNASDDIDMALNFFCLSISDTKGRCLLIGKGRNFKNLFFDAKMCRCHCDVSNMHKCTLFSMGLKRSCACSFVHLKMHKCTNAQFLAFDGTPSEKGSLFSGKNARRPTLQLVYVIEFEVMMDNNVPFYGTNLQLQLFVARQSSLSCHAYSCIDQIDANCEVGGKSDCEEKWRCQSIRV